EEDIGRSRAPAARIQVDVFGDSPRMQREGGEDRQHESGGKGVHRGPFFWLYRDQEQLPESAVMSVRTSTPCWTTGAAFNSFGSLACACMSYNTVAQRESSAGDPTFDGSTIVRPVE